MARPLVFLVTAYVAGITLGRFFTPTIFILPAAAAFFWILWQVFMPLLLLFLVAGGQVRISKKKTIYFGSNCVIVTHVLQLKKEIGGNNLGYSQKHRGKT